MSDSEKELEKRVLEAGENLLDQPPPSSIRRLLQLLDLDEVLCCLSEVEQNPPNSMKNALSPSIKALAAAELFKHSDLDVKVNVAACICQIMRIYAPYAPYDNEKMKEAFQLMVSSFEHLSDMCSCSYAKRILILKTVSEHKFVTMMLDLECDVLVIEMFQHFLNVIRNHHPNEVFLCVENIMTHALEERDDIPLEMLSSILHYVKKDNKILQVSQRLAEQVLINWASEHKTLLAKAVKSSGVTLDKYSNVVASICEGTFSGLKQNKVVAKPAHLLSSLQDLQSKKTTVQENKCVAKEGHPEKTKPSTTKATTEELNTSEDKFSRKSASSSRAKPTVPPTTKQNSEKKAVEMIFCKKPRSQRRKKKSQDVGKPQKIRRYQILHGDNKKASDLQNYDEKLVGSRIRVWWPLDRRSFYGIFLLLYAGFRVCYDDGDQEILNLKTQKWYFVDESKSSKDQEANQTGLDEEAFTMPQKKKAKTSKGHSANKQSKMDIPQEMLSSVPPYAKKYDEVPQVSRRFVEQVFNSCGSQLKTHQTEAVKSSKVSIAKPSNVVDSECDGAFDAVTQENSVVDSECDGAFDAVTQENGVPNEKEDNQKPVKISTPEQTCVHAASSSINKNGHEAVSPRCETVAEVKTQEKKTHEMVQPPMAEEDDPVDAETRTHKRARVESCSLHEGHDEMEKTAAADREHSCCNKKASAEPEHDEFPKPCSVLDHLAKMKQSIVDTITSVKQFHSELETKEQSIVDILASVRQFRSEIKQKEDHLEASMQEVDVLGEKIMGINKILNS